MMFSRAGFRLGQQNYPWSDLDLEVVFTVMLLVLLYYFLHGFLNEWKSSKLPPGPWPWPIVGNLPHIASALPHRTLRALANKFGGLMYLQLGMEARDYNRHQFIECQVLSIDTMFLMFIQHLKFVVQSVVWWSVSSEPII